MPIQHLKYHEFDPDIDYEEIIPSPLKPFDPLEPIDPSVPDAVHCCKCTEGSSTLCSTETSLGATATTATAQMFAYWYS